MLEGILEFIKNSKEIQGWGDYWLIAGALGTVICSIVQAIGVTKQNKNIKEAQSAESLSEITIAYYLFCFITFLIYGIRKDSLAMAFNGSLFSFYIPFLRNIYKFKKIPRWKSAIVSCMPLLPIIMIIMPKEYFESYMLSLLGVVLVVLGLQIYVLCKNRKPGVINIFYFSTFVIGNICWFVFSMNAADPVMQIFSVLSTACQIAIISLTIYFKRKNKKSLDIQSQNS